MQKMTNTKEQVREYNKESVCKKMINIQDEK